MDDYIKILVGTQQIGIIGLKKVLAEIAQSAADLNEEQIGPMIRDKLAGKNYFPPTAAPLYDQAFLHQYRKHLGLNDASEQTQEASIKVLGPGCPRCRHLRDMVLRLLSERNLAVNFTYITDPLEIAGEGIVLTPALIINGEVKVSGRLPQQDELLKWIGSINP